MTAHRFQRACNRIRVLSLAVRPPPAIANPDWCPRAERYDRWSRQPELPAPRSRSSPPSGLPKGPTLAKIDAGMREIWCCKRDGRRGHHAGSRIVEPFHLGGLVPKWEERFEWRPSWTEERSPFHMCSLIKLQWWWTGKRAVVAVAAVVIVSTYGVCGLTIKFQVKDTPCDAVWEIDVLVVA